MHGQHRLAPASHATQSTLRHLFRYPSYALASYTTLINPFRISPIIQQAAKLIFLGSGIRDRERRC